MKKLIFLGCAGLALLLAGCRTNYDNQGAPPSGYETNYGSSAGELMSPSGFGPQYRNFDTFYGNPAPPIERTPYPETRPPEAAPGSPMEYEPPVLPPEQR